MKNYEVSEFMYNAYVKRYIRADYARIDTKGCLLFYVKSSCTCDQLCEAFADGTWKSFRYTGEGEK